MGTLMWFDRPLFRGSLRAYYTRKRWNRDCWQPRFVPVEWWAEWSGSIFFFWLLAFETSSSSVSLTVTNCFVSDYLPMFVTSSMPWNDASNTCRSFDRDLGKAMRVSKAIAGANQNWTARRTSSVNGCEISKSLEPTKVDSTVKQNCKE